MFSETHVVTIPKDVAPGIMLRPSSSWLGMLEVEGFVRVSEDDADVNESLTDEDSFGAAHAQVQIGFVLVRVNSFLLEGLTVMDQLVYLNSQICLRRGVELGFHNSKLQRARSSTPTTPALLLRCAECEVVVCCAEERDSVLCEECSIKSQETVLSSSIFLPGSAKKARGQGRRRRRRSRR